MKKSLFLTSILFLFFVAGCEKSDKYDSEEVVRLTVASVKPVEKEENYDYDYEGCWLPLYICKRGTDAEWRLWHTWACIEHFDDVYEEGYEYVIDIYERHLSYSGPTGNPWRYQLKKIISKVRKESEGIPERFTME